MDIGMSDFKFMDGKRVGVLMDTEPEIMLTEWENKNGIHTEHVNVNNDNDVEKKLANHEIDCFVSLEESGLNREYHLLPLLANQVYILQ